MIEGIFVEPLKVISNEKGKLMHMIRSDSSYFKNFGEIYFSTVNPGFIKGWKKHRKMRQHIAVPVGNIRLVIYDDRENSRTKNSIDEFFIGEANYQLVSIPPLVWYAFKAVGNSYALIANCPDLPHDPLDAITINPFDKQIPYSWE